MRNKYCNICGVELDEWDQMADFTIQKDIGYGSKYDGETLSIHICIDCMDRIIDSCKTSPIVHNHSDDNGNTDIFNLVK